MTRLTEIWRYRELVRQLVLKELRLHYGTSRLGVLWALAQPLLYIGVYSVAFGFLLPVKTENYTLFLISGVLPWTFAANALTGATHSITANAHLVKKIHFPTEVLPIARVLFDLVRFMPGFVLFLVCAPWLGMESMARVVPALAAVGLLALFLVGLGLPLAGLSVFYRDVHHATDVGMRGLFWLTPVVYPLAAVPDSAARWIAWSPLSPFLRLFHGLVPGMEPAAGVWIQAIGYVLASLLLGSLTFRRRADRFAEEL